MKSMTGFGRGESMSEGWRCRVEMAAVNRKQSDIVISLPRDWQELEIRLRHLVADRVSRGRVNVTVKVERATGPRTRVQFDAEAARQYLEAIEAMEKKMHRPVDVSAADLLRAPGVFALEDSELAAPDAWPPLARAAGHALDALDQSRRAEGRALTREVKARLTALDRLRKAIARHAPQVPARHRELLHRRLAEAGLTLALEDDRLVKEVAIFAERCDVTEELIRFTSHLEQFNRLLRSREPEGRAADFLCQELHRELNTMGAKANDSAIAHLVVEGKTEVEKLREQVQNVE